jgi:hypothetical protein
MNVLVKGDVKVLGLGLYSDDIRWTEYGLSLA